MGGSVPQTKKRSIHVRSHISNRPNFFRFAFSKIFAPMNSPFTGPPAIELALGISSGSRYCVMYYPYYQNTYGAIVIEFPKLTVHWNEREKNCDGKYMSPEARYVLK